MHSCAVASTACCFSEPKAPTWFAWPHATLVNCARGQRHGNGPSPTAGQRVLKLTSELGAALSADGLVQPQFGWNVQFPMLGCACRRPGHVASLQVLDAHHRVILVERGRGPLQDVAARVAESGNRLLRKALMRFVPPETAQLRKKSAITHQGKARNPPAEADRTAVRYRFLDVPFGHIRHEPCAAVAENLEVAHRSANRAAV